MNRRGFLALLGAALAEPLIPKGTAFSFLGGIYRPAWEEVPTAWPIPYLEIDQGRMLLIEGSLECMRAGPSGMHFFRSDAAPPGVKASISGLSPLMSKPILLRDRAGNMIIRETGKPLTRPAPAPLTIVDVPRNTFPLEPSTA